MGDVEPGRRRLLWLIIGGVIVVAAVVVTVLLLNRPQPETPPPATPTAPSQQPTPSASVEPPTAQELSALDAALRSKDAAALAPYLQLSPEDELDPEFVKGVAALEITIDAATVRPVSDGLFEVKATDKGGSGWVLGLVRRPDGGLNLSYAEPA